MAQGAWGNGQWAWGNGHGAWGMGFSCFRYAVIVVVGCVPHERSSSRVLLGGTHANCSVRSVRACAVARVELAERTLIVGCLLHELVEFQKGNWRNGPYLQHVSRTLMGGTHPNCRVRSARA